MVNRLLRYSRYSLTCLSVAVIVAVICIWRRTNSIHDELRYVTRAGVLYAVGTHPRGIIISKATHFRDMPRMDWYRPPTPDGFSFESERWWASYTRDVTPMRSLKLKKNVAEVSVNPLEAFVKSEAPDYSVISNETFEIESDTIEPPQNLICGFGFRLENLAASTQSGSPSRVISISSPLYLFVAMASIFPLLSLARTRSALRRRRRRRQNRCITCGYNLTGNTSGVCSECGTVKE
jgi:hypothetical protein